MLETLVSFAVMIAPYVLIAAGALGIFLLVARMTAKFVAPAVKAGG
jgi:hypothetical protein